MKKSTSFLVAEFTDFPGLRMPLLSDEECKARGIEQPKFPPFKTWTEQQQEAGRKLRDVFAKMAVQQALRRVAKQLDLMVEERYDKADFEKEAARRALAEIKAGKWKAERDEVYGLDAAMGWALESILRDGEPKRAKRARRTRK